MYSGNSPNKSVARTIGYNRVAKEHGKRFLSGKHIVIASRDCGDIRYLVEHNVQAKNILACDTDSVARSVATTWGVHVSKLPRIEDTLAVINARANVVSINLDLCTTLVAGIPVLTDVMESVSSLRTSPTILFTFARYRDGMHSSKERHSLLKSSVRFYRETVTFHDYTSYSYSSKGSPMCLAIM